MARWFVTFDAVNPKNPATRWKTGIHEDVYRKLQIHGDDRRIARLLLVEEILCGGVKLLYRGWSRPDKEESFVYAGLPTRDYKSLTIETPAPKGMFFLVFVLPDGTIDEWTWRKAEADGSRPSGIKGELIWQQNPS
jgi:hypothetical protein